MTQEEKAKAYDEALEKAKKYHEEYWQVDAKNITETLFPELAESEDERIRKALWKYIHDFKPVCDNEFLPPFTIDDILAWLEKQKEQKPAEWGEEDEKMLTGIIARGSSQVPPYEPALREEQMEWLMNRLKSLRPQPHWKPSEEEIEAVRYFVNKHQSEAWAATGQWKQFTALRGLLGKLERLM